MRGRVKWFSIGRGYGFIECSGENPDVFVHGSAITGEDFGVLQSGEEVEFDVVKSEKGLSAANVFRLGDGAEVSGEATA